MIRLTFILLSFARHAYSQISTDSNLEQNHSLSDDVRWLQFMNTFQTRLTLNRPISSQPMCTTWLSNNHQTTRSVNKTISNLERWGKHCISNIDCVQGQLSFQNQGLSITEQLTAGVRRLVLELHYVPGMKKRLRLCASLQVECTAMKKNLKTKRSKKKKKSYNWCKGFQMTSKGAHTGCHSGSPEFKNAVRDIIKWLNKNQDQFLVIDLIDYVTMETGCGIVSEVDNSLRLFGSRLLKPSHLQNDNRTDKTLPSLRELREMRKNVLIRSSCTFGGSYVFPARETDYVSMDRFNSDVCEREASNFTLYYHDRIHVDLRLSSRRKVRQYRTLRTPTQSDLQQAARCNSQIALQASNYSDLFGCSWTWLPHHHNQACTGCTSFYLDPNTMTYGWVNTECSRTLHLACREREEGHFTVSGSFQHLPNNGDLRACGEDLVFALPLTPREAYSLAESMWSHGLSHVWLPRIQGYTCTDVAQDIQCGDPEIPLNGTLMGEDRGFDAVVRYECDLGFRLVGSLTRNCQSNGSWTGTVPVCQRVDCGFPPYPANGKVYGTTTDFGSMYGYTCNWGHVFEGQASTVSIVTTCQENGMWSVNVPDCIRRQCEVSEWSDWGECSAICEGGVQTRSREVLSSHGNEINGNCPSLEETRVCNTRICDTCTTKVYRTFIEADECRSDRPVTNRFCFGTCREAGMCCKPTVKSTKNITLFCDKSPPRNFGLSVIEECGCVPCG
ncbi:hypothetical protein ACHWQZ_G011835 [Mnemiopsis leidyi]